MINSEFLEEVPQALKAYYSEDGERMSDLEPDWTSPGLSLTPAAIFTVLFASADEVHMAWQSCVDSTLVGENMARRGQHQLLPPRGTGIRGGRQRRPLARLVRRAAPGQGLSPPLARARRCPRSRLGLVQPKRSRPSARAVC